MKIDADTNEIVDVIPVGRAPGEVAVVGDYVVVSSEQDATLTRVDGGSGETTTSGASGADLGLTAAGDRFAWVVSLQLDRVTRVNVESLQSIDGVPLAPDLAYAFVAVGGGSLWVTQLLALGSAQVRAPDTASSSGATTSTSTRFRSSPCTDTARPGSFSVPRRHCSGSTRSPVAP